MQVVSYVGAATLTDLSQILLLFWFDLVCDKRLLLIDRRNRTGMCLEIKLERYTGAVFFKEKQLIIIRFLIYLATSEDAPILVSHTSCQEVQERPTEADYIHAVLCFLLDTMHIWHFFFKIKIISDNKEKALIAGRSCHLDAPNGNTSQVTFLWYLTTLN